MARRLTTFSKFLITLLIIGAIAFIGRYFLTQTDVGKGLADKAGVEQPKSSDSGSSSANSGSTSNTNTNPGNTNSGSSDDVIRIGVVTWGGYAGGQYFNEGFEATKNSRFYKDYGFQVEFKVLDDFEASRNAFRAGEVDLL